ncbi:MAG: hypothetical protein ACQESR_06225 [Planctomycetota bacterium]
MKKSINLWAFPYPERMSLKECLQMAKDAGFEAVELNYDLENDLSPKAGASDLRAIRQLADKIGYRGYLTFEYFHPYSHYPEALIYQTSDSLDRIMGRIS